MTAWVIALVLAVAPLAAPDVLRPATDRPAATHAIPFATVPGAPVDTTVAVPVVPVAPLAWHALPGACDEPTRAVSRAPQVARRRAWCGGRPRLGDEPPLR